MAKEEKAVKSANKEEKAVKAGLEIEVGDPQILRPKELPLVVKPVGGEWANEAQAKFAATLNGYAYKNPEKWAVKKDVLIAQLKELETNPSKIFKFEGGAEGNLSFKNKLIES